MKNWELKHGDKVKNGDEIYIFDKMDGMYAHWTDKEGKLKIGNFNNLIKNGEYYEPKVIL